MENTAKEMMHNYVKSQKFSSTAEIMEAMKDMFRDALEQVMECELEEHLGYEKSERVRNWDMVLNQLNILFADRIPA